jgi:hypothetical protein
MATIPTIERTEDFIYRLEVKKGTPLRDHGEPNVLVFEQGVELATGFHSMDVMVLRDMARASDIEFRSFEHFRDRHMTFVRFIFHDHLHDVMAHDYLLTVILRYLQSR